MGDTVGDTVGETVGETVGDTVGDTVGETVGETVGDTVGDTVVGNRRRGRGCRSRVGGRCGVAVGVAVGVGVTAAQSAVSRCVIEAVAVVVEAQVQWVAGEFFFQARIARIQIHKGRRSYSSRTVPRRHDVLARGREVRREGVAMAVTANFTVRCRLAHLHRCDAGADRLPIPCCRVTGPKLLASSKRP